MAVMVIFTSYFMYENVNLKDRIIIRIVDQTELISDLVIHSVEDFLAGKHNKKTFSSISTYSDVIGIDKISIFKPNGEEAFKDNKEKRNAVGKEAENLQKAVRTMNHAEYFDMENNTFVTFVPIFVEESCAKCHGEEGDIVGVVKVGLATGNDFELLDKIKHFIWALLLIILLPIGGILISGLIIMDKNRLFADLKESKSDLEKLFAKMDETQQYLQMILDNSKAIIWTTDNDHKIVEFNKEAQLVTGYGKEAVVGKHAEIIYAGPTKRAKLLAKRKNIGKNLWEARSDEVELKSKEGRSIYVSMIISPLLDATGQEVGKVAVCKDITESKILQFQLVQSEKLAGIGTLASGIAHEINNPLAGILGMAEAIRDEDDLELIRSYTDDIIQYAEHGSNIVKELSGYSRSAKTESASIMEIAESMQDSLKMAKHSSEFDSIEVDENLEGGCLVNANKGELQQVFVNLMVNASHAMDGKGNLTLKCFKVGKMVRATISDNGSGIDLETKKQIFDPFFTTKPAGEGTGLGLYVVYKIITKYRGVIDIDTKVGKGTTFIIEFPLTNSDAESLIT